MLSRRLKELRTDNKMSQKDLAARLYVSAQAVGKWERDEATPNPETLLKIATIFNVSVDNLLGRDDEKAVTQKDDGPEDPLDAQLKKLLPLADTELKKAFLALLEHYKE